MKQDSRTNNQELQLVPDRSQQPEETRGEPLIEPYPDLPVGAHSLSLQLPDSSDPDAPWQETMGDRVFIHLQTGGERYHIHAVDHSGIVCADVSEATFGSGRRIRREMTEIDIQTLRDEVIAVLPDDAELQNALARPNGLREFLGIPE
jgi:hypothetical protein